MKPLQWVDGALYRIPSRTACGTYCVFSYAGGSRGPTFRAQIIVGVGQYGPIGQVRDSIEDAKADAQTHADDIARQATAAAKDPTA